ncbi:RIP metalloprotease RseP [Halothiobacillus diazotrophicus]|uniref:Zinc metalloprotease n=1 Tax=Halothiobacillus diazotrophicus TaxID=1860122 RepID=A0A191ZE08_9GAMM|nr:RIP metalloprotease RseP [Halothiobacillus diazotrophicus]ANJ66099.1 RIP metalloprotease RseP [Halothiobacillus diazotrophicus]
MSIAMSILGFLLTIGVLVAFHEYGHYWMARRLGVKVLTYSLGFGKALWSTRRGPDQTEYRIALLPLGGFVKMLDEREGPVAAAEQHRAFNRQPVWKRFLIVLAGPVANILLALVLWAAMFMVGVQGVLPKVGVLPSDSILAKSGLQDGDVITQVGGSVIHSLSDLRLAVLEGGVANARVPIEFEHQGAISTGTLDLSELKPLAGSTDGRPRDVLKEIGYRLWSPPGDAVIHKVLPNSAAAAAGLQAGDLIRAVNGESYRDPGSLIQRIEHSPGKAMTLQIVRDGQTRTLAVTPRPVEAGGARNGKVGRIGAEIALSPAAIQRARDSGVRLLVLERFGPVTALGMAVERSWAMTSLTFQVFGGLLSGQASLSNLSGPVAIAEFAGQSLLIGFSTFLGFLALVSLSLAIMNLLPVPLLDGGHLAMYVIEAIRGKAPGPQFEAMATRVGLFFLVSLMIVAFYNDIARLMHS